MKKTSLIATAIIIVIGLGGFIYFNSKNKNQETRYLESVAKIATIEIKVLTTGTVLPENRLEIKAPIAGRIEKVLVDEGYKIRKGQILAWMSSTERAAMLDAARAEGSEELKRWEQMYQAAPIVSPINGTIISRNAEAGQTITTSDAILVMSDLLIVKAQVDETDMAQIKLKQEAEIILDAYPKTTIPARVDKIAYEAETVNNVTNYKIDLTPHHTTELMRSGMTANVTFFAQRLDNVLTVASNAIQREEGMTYVFVKGKKENEPQKREIKIGPSDEKLTQVLEGLTEGETILIPNKKITKSNGANANPFGPRSPGVGGGRGAR